jgi:hypothetical protein
VANLALRHLRQPRSTICARAVIQFRPRATQTKDRVPDKQGRCHSRRREGGVGEQALVDQPIAPAEDIIS